MAILLPTLWLGVLIGVSFIATPVKFRAPSLTRPVALEVGRITFRLFSRIEWGFAALLLGIGATSNGVLWRLPLSGIVVAIVALQSTWLLPVNRRISLLIAGESLGPSHVHQIYSAVEGIKLLALVTLVAAGIAQ
jgi:hypothetical protein